MVVILMREHNVSVQGAMDLIEARYQQKARDFVRRMSNLPTFESKKVQMDVQRYIWGIGNWVTANYEWSFETDRYWNGAKLDEEMKNAHDLMIELMPQQQVIASYA